MAKISEIVSQATPTYQPDNLNQFGRDINNIIQKYPNQLEKFSQNLAYLR